MQSSKIDIVFLDCMKRWLICRVVHPSNSSMSPAAGDAAHTPEAKGTSGLVSVFKSLTGTKSNKSPSLRSQASVAQQLNNAHTPKSAIYGGPPNYELLCNQIKAANALSERIAAAEALQHAVLDYPLNSVCRTWRSACLLTSDRSQTSLRKQGILLSQRSHNQPG